MLERLCCPVDAYLLLERDGKLLMLRRAAGAAYAAGLLCPPSGHVEAGEDALSAAVRETAEETGVTMDPDQVHCAAVVHHQSPSGQARIGWFFAAGPGWSGEPVNREPAKHSELVWIDPSAPPPDLVAYTWAGLRAYAAAAPYAIHFQSARSPAPSTTSRAAKTNSRSLRGPRARERRPICRSPRGTVRVERSLTELQKGGLAFGPPKSDTGTRTVAFPDLITPILRWHLSCFARPGEHGQVFTGPNGALLRRSNFRRRTWIKALAAARLPSIHFHDLRHTGNHLTASSGASLRELMARMGPQQHPGRADLPSLNRRAAA